VSVPREGARVTSRLRRVLPAFAGVLCAAVVARADWLAPDASFRDAQMQVRYATRDTVGHSDDVGRIDTLAVALLRLGRVAEARTLFQRTLAAKPGDPTACAALGKLALWADRLAQASERAAQESCRPLLRGVEQQ